MKKFIKFLLGGGISYLIKLVCTYFLTNVLNIHYLFAYAVTMIGIMTYGFFYNFYFVFTNMNNKKNKFIIYVLSLILFTGIDIYFVKILTEKLNIFYLGSIIISTTLLFTVKFIVYHKLLFLDYNNLKGGNYFNKQKSKNPFIKYLMEQFHGKLFAIIHKLKIKKLLDVGCGEGYTTQRIHQQFPEIEIAAIENDAETVTKAIALNQDLKIKKGNIYKMEYEDNHFDCVLSTEVLEHLENPDLAVEECKRISKKYCIFTVPYEPWWRIANIIRFTYLSRFGNTPGHIQHWNKNKFKKMLKKHFRYVNIKNSILWNIGICKKDNEN